MKILRAVSLSLAVLSAIVLVTSFVTVSRFSKLAETYQLVEPTPESALFGGVGNKIGSPQEYIITLEDALMDERDENGVQLVDNTILKENNVYPLQMKTVRETGNLVNIASIGGLLVGFVAGFAADKKLKSHA